MAGKLGSILRAARELHGLSPHQVSGLCGLNSTTTWRIEEGTTDPRLMSQLVPLAQAVGLDLLDLIPHFQPKKGKKPCQRVKSKQAPQ